MWPMTPRSGGLRCRRARTGWRTRTRWRSTRTWTRRRAERCEKASSRCRSPAAPSGSVFVVYSVTNGEETHRHCTKFDGCAHKGIAGGTGSLLVCNGNSMGDPACRAVPCGFVDQGLTVLDTCTHLEWEKKDGADGAEDPANPHDVDNRN